MMRERHLVRGSARIDVWCGGESVVRMKGVMREANVGAWLLPLVDEIHDVAIREQLTEVVLDIRVLEYANAALWRCLVHWIKRLQRERPGSYKLRVVSDPRRSWQQVGVPTLHAFSVDASGDERLILQSTGDRASLS